MFWTENKESTVVKSTEDIPSLEQKLAFRMKGSNHQVQCPTGHPKNHILMTQMQPM